MSRRSGDASVLPYAYATTMVAIAAVSLLALALPELAATYGVTVSDVAWIQIGVLLPGILSASGLLWLAASRGLARVLAVSLLVYGVAGAANFGMPTSDWPSCSASSRVSAPAPCWRGRSRSSRGGRSTYVTRASAATPLSSAS